MSSSNNATIGFPGLLTVLFIALKLTNVIAWSWVWVLSPLWISLSITLIVLAVILAVYLSASK
jgi:hypothetical protein